MALERKLNKMRSLTFPRLSTSTQSEHQEDTMYSFAPAHSRDSSSASSASSPVTPTFSTRSHGRWPSSSSSLASSPDSPVNIAKATLEDLVEEVAERDDNVEGIQPEIAADEPFCICDTPYCEHQRTISGSHTPSSSAYPEWTRGDDLTYNFEPPPRSRMKRSSSAEFAGSIFGSRRRQRWHSLSSRWHSRRPTLSISSQTVQSAPPTPGSSSRRPSASQSLINSLDSRQTIIYPESQKSFTSDSNWATSNGEPITPGDESHDGSLTEPIDREALSRTPILSHLLTESRNDLDEPIQSPLQSATVATHSETASIANASICSPVLSGLITPPLSAKPSVTSMSVRPPFGHAEEEPDIWAMRLGHANFTIDPKPYLPVQCTGQACRRLLEDWEAARVEYMRIIARVSEHYGPSSPTYRLSEEKWAEIDREWRFNLEQANAEAEAIGETPVSQCLAETQPISKMPSLVDPSQPTKFLDVDEANIVGPMVQYVGRQQSSTKRTGFFSFFKEPGSLLGRSVFASKR